MNKQELKKYLDDYLKISEFKDSSKNGLQVDTNKQEIKKIGYGVDASTYIFDKAIYEEVDMVLSHHGLYWGYEETMTGVCFERATQLIKNDI
jgi:putative NIF3 family GTP cyclohydrolase 1 type 2